MASPTRTSSVHEELDRIHNRLSRIPPGEKEKLRRVYDTEVFPRLVEIHRNEATHRSTAEILFVAVGTQPYSPALALIANPYRRAVLLYTDNTRSFVPTVLDFYRRGMTTSVEEAVEKAYIGDGTQSARVMQVIHSKYLTAGEPPPDQVVVDVTSGRKATAAAMGAISAARDFRQVYLEGDPHPQHPWIVFTTRHVQLPSALLLCGQNLRMKAAALIRAGNPRHAEKVLKSLIREGFAGESDMLCHEIVAWWSRLTEQKFPQSRRILVRIAKTSPRLLRSPLAESLLEYLFEKKTGQRVLTAALAEWCSRRGQKELGLLYLSFLNRKGPAVREVVASIFTGAEQERVAAARKIVRTLLGEVWDYGM